MRIAIDATCWANRRGFGRFARELITAITNLNTGDEWLLLADRQTAATIPNFSPPLKGGAGGGCRVVVGDTTVSPSQAASADGRRSIRDMWAMRTALSRQRVDLIFFPAVYSYFPVAGRTPCIVTFHDVIAETLPHLIFHTRRSRWFWRLKCRAALRRATAVLTVSEASKRGLMQHFGLPDSRIHVMPEAASAPFGPLDRSSDAHRAALDRYDLSTTRFLLYVGGISPHKNLATLIDAFARIAQDPAFPDIRLVLVGDYAGDVFRTCHDDLVQQADRLGVTQRVLFPGFVPDADLAHLYAACEAFVFPSYLEGFGLPAVEAMSCGAAVIASDRGSLPEVLDGAGILFDPHDAAALADALRSVLNDPTRRDQLRDKSVLRAAAFTWERSARRAVEVFHEVALT